MSEGLILTTTERYRFAQWCEMYAHSTELVMSQQEKLALPPAILEALGKKHKAEIAACRIVHRLLTEVEEQSIGKDAT